MTKRLDRKHFVYLALGLMAAGLLIQNFATKPSLAPPVTVYASTNTFFQSSFTDLEQAQQAASQWQGKLLVVNFWATWCAPCREEMPELSELHAQYQAQGVEVLGISLDNTEKMRGFAANTPVNYPLLAADSEGMAISASLGNDKGVVPYTVIIGTDGKIVKSYFGRISKALLEETLQPLLSKTPTSPG
ncbi:TlpA family protein disulfide reductase [Methylobacillus caricis]|uniref:TlpA family protein disulfide reductase n=1 Tax=Methylobacillus caricis TaxID=1971611 RepID=UPI001D001166|nr:TlpA disulfide reductase family protein [Methylobacillus caricis]MCB5189076.1 TlpA family protein disulfide reductase [Methylobacillus caricis]